MRLNSAVRSAIVMAALAMPPAALAGAGSTPAEATWREECGSCHVAYPPRFLPASSWSRLMAGLADHFGTDATISPERTAEIATFLAANAGQPRGDRDGDKAQAPLRITQTRWFLSEHDELPPSAWRNPAIRGPSNCAACHTRADQGSFRESEIRIPGGARQ